jgi:hypothetical protein
LPNEPPARRVVAFIDAQNLFHAAKEAFGYSHPNFDAPKLAGRPCQERAWALAEVRLYTGVPAAADKAFLSEVADEIRLAAKEQDRWIKIASDDDARTPRTVGATSKAGGPPAGAA